MTSVKNWIHIPIIPNFKKPDDKFVDAIRQGSKATLLQENSRLIVDNHYFKTGVNGSLPVIYLRSFLVGKISEALKNISPDYGCVIFDGYRSKETQKGLFEAYFAQIKLRYPSWSEEDLHKETRKFVAHPDEPSRFEIPPHNSGGAVDIGLTKNGKILDMGTPFDDLTEKASTSFFEQTYDPKISSQEKWNEIRDNRRILFHSLISVGFTNWKYEWWHFDLGNCVWAQELGLPWIYDSMKI